MASMPRWSAARSSSREQLVELLVHVAMVGELVAAGEDGLDGVGVLLDTPAGHEERLAEPVAREQLEQAGDGHQGVVAEHRGHGHAVRRGVAMVDVEQALGVHVEAERHRAARTVRPGDRVFEHGGASRAKSYVPPPFRATGGRLTAVQGLWLR